MEFRLLVKSEHYSSSASCLIVDGISWQLTHPLSLDASTDVPEFACISYVWGQSRELNPFYTGEVMSSNTLPALSAAIYHSAVSAFWIDALCVPKSGSTRLATLSSMGYIYSKAVEVLVYFPEGLCNVIKEMQDNDRISESSLKHLGHDKWVQSVWTYQEVVNAGSLYFIAGTAKVNGTHFLNCLGYSLELYKKTHHVNNFNIFKAMPNLDALEELLADWMTGDYGERSALRIMAQSKYRSNADANFFHAFVGTIVKGPLSWKMDTTIEELSRDFMDSCEKQGDYSFIYSSNPRQPEVEKWRPELGALHAILIWHSYGNGQKGHYDREGFWLERMIRLNLSYILEDSAKSFLLNWETRNSHEPFEYSGIVSEEMVNELSHRIFIDLREMSFTGTGKRILSREGIFYPQMDVENLATDETEVLVAADLKWTFGAPGLVKVLIDGSYTYVPGVFVGLLDENNADDVLLN